MELITQLEAEVSRLKREYDAAYNEWWMAESPTALPSRMFEEKPYEGPDPQELKRRLEAAEYNLSSFRAALVTGEAALRAILERPSTTIAVSEVLAAVAAISPELIQHLKRNEADLDRLPWDVFEHLVGEFLAGSGFDDVRLVGRDPRTSADIFALYSIQGIATNLRFYVEVKRTRHQIGIGTVNAVLGAMVAERQIHGWHAALLVSTAVHANYKKTSPLELSLAGLELRDRNDVLRMLRDYSPSPSGLWLPSPSRRLPDAADSAC